MSAATNLNTSTAGTATTLTDTPVMHAELAASDGASLVGFISGEIGASPRTVQDKLRDVLSVRDFGAIGDNVHDDTAAFQSALAIASGKSLNIPAGTYKITSPLIVPPTTFIHGAGNKDTYLFFTLPHASTASLLSVNPSSTNDLQYGFGLTDLSVIDLTEATGTTGILVKNLVGGLIQNVNMTGMHVGLSFVNGLNRIVNLEISTLGGDLPSAVGVMADGTNCGVGIYDSIIQSSTSIGSQIGIGYLFKGGAAPTMHSANTFGCSVGCQLTATGTTMYWPELISCQFDTASGTGLLINTGVGGAIYGLSCQNLWCGTMGAYGIHVAPGSGIINGLQFNGGRIFNNANAGILIEGGENISLCSMQISGNGSGTSPGIAVLGQVSGLVISGNKIGQLAQFLNSQNYGIQFSATPVSYVTITGNDLSGNIADGIYNGSTTPTAILTTGNVGYSANNPIAPALENSWVNNGGATATASYYKDADNIVRISGLIKSGTMTAPAFTLPSGYRPLADQYFACVSNGQIGYAFVQASTGNVIPQAGSNLYFSLCGITFRAEQ